MAPGSIPMTTSSVLNHLSWGVNALNRLCVCVREFNIDHTNQNTLH